MNCTASDTLNDFHNPSHATIRYLWMNIKKTPYIVKNEMYSTMYYFIFEGYRSLTKYSSRVMHGDLTNANENNRFLAVIILIYYALYITK